MAFPPDPGNRFDSDVHRRVQANLPNPDDEPLSVEAIMTERVAKDDHLDITVEELAEVLKDLEADGHSKKTKDGWRNTPEGFSVLTDQPIPDA